ncbi:MAG: RHS repeat-associated core domain-containing protein, partial [Pseudomonadota bacterium]
MSDGTRTEYEYDYRNRLVSVQEVIGGNAPTVVAEYFYDGLNRRIAKITATDTRVYLHEGQNVIAETDAAGNVLLRRMYEATLPDAPIAYELPAGDRWLLADQVGSARHTLDENGELADLFPLSAYGRVPDSAPVGLIAPVFQSLDYEADVRLYHADARYYDPDLGRFRSEDPIGFVGGDPNLYRYGDNNPYRFTDPSGRASLSYAQINKRIAVFQRKALQCLGNGVFTTAGEVGVYLIIEAVALKYSRNGPANVYAGRTRNKGGFGVRFYQHKRGGRQIVGRVQFPVAQHIINNPVAFAELEQLLIDSFGGKAQLTNKRNAVSPRRKK